MSRKQLLLLLSAVGMAACDRGPMAELPDGSCAHVDLKGSPPPDLMPSPAKCLAAKGLSGDNLLCKDFASLSDQALASPPPQALSGWDFVTNCGGKNWEIKGGKLQIAGFSGFMSTCGFLMPALSSADYQKYSSFTLSVVQTVDLNKLKQSAAIYLGLAIDTQQSWLTTGTNPRQITTITLDRSALPNGGSGVYQPLFQIVSSVGVGGANGGWQIESIAINASP